MTKRMLLFIAILWALAPSAYAVNGGSGLTLPATCTTGEKFDVTPMSTAFDCIGTNTWKPQGASRIIAIVKAVNINATNVDIPIAMPQGARYAADNVRITGATVNLSTTAARVGIWTGAGATGVNIVTAASSATVLQALTSAAAFKDGALGITVTSTLATVFLRCTVVHGSAATVDLYIMGDVLP